MAAPDSISFQILKNAANKNKKLDSKIVVIQKAIKKNFYKLKTLLTKYL
jgi:hypothetical protein